MMQSKEQPPPRGRIRRTMPLAGFAARAAGGRLVAGLRERAGDEGAVERFHEDTAARYTDILGHSKGTLMKAGQILSMIDASAIGNGGFAPYQRALARLQTNAPPMPAALVRSILDGEFGGRMALFADLDTAPVAAASIGQVHRGTLRDGRQVAVKVQYPGVGEVIRDDLANAELLTTFLRFAFAASGVAMDIRGMAAEVTARVGEEVDYRHEAAMITAFGDLYRGHPFIRIPDVIPDLSTDRVLTMTYLDGFDWAEAQSADQDLKNTWAEGIYRFLNGNSRHANLAHADPHPGNFRFHPDGGVGVLDFGCVQIADEDRRWLFWTNVRAAIEERYDDCRELMIRMGLLAADSSLSQDGLRLIVSELIYEVIAPQPVTFTPESMGRRLRGFFGDRESQPVTQLSATREFVFLPRIGIAFHHIAAGLRATVPARAIVDDLEGVAEPTTELGRQHHAWRRERGLPCGLDHHEAPRFAP